MKSAYQIIRRPVITEKGLGVKETESTLVFEVAAKATKTEVKEAVQSIFKVKVASVRTASFDGWASFPNPSPLKLNRCMRTACFTSVVPRSRRNASHLPRPRRIFARTPCRRHWRSLT